MTESPSSSASKPRTAWILTNGMAGFEVRRVRTFMFGTVALHVAEKP